MSKIKFPSIKDYLFGWMPRKEKELSLFPENNLTNSKINFIILEYINYKPFLEELNQFTNNVRKHLNFCMWDCMYLRKEIIYCFGRWDIYTLHENYNLYDSNKRKLFNEKLTLEQEYKTNKNMYYNRCWMSY